MREQKPHSFVLPLRGRFMSPLRGWGSELFGSSRAVRAIAISRANPRRDYGRWF